MPLSILQLRKQLSFIHFLQYFNRNIKYCVYNKLERVNWWFLVSWVAQSCELRHYIRSLLNRIGDKITFLSIFHKHNYYCLLQCVRPFMLTQLHPHFLTNFYVRGVKVFVSDYSFLKYGFNCRWFHSERQEQPLKFDFVRKTFNILISDWLRDQFHWYFCIMFTFKFTSF